MTRERQRRGTTAEGDAVPGPENEPVNHDEGVSTSAPRRRPRAARAPHRGVKPRVAEIAVVPVGGINQRRAVAQSRAEAHDLYVAARDAWTAAMKAASSGRAADLAALAIVQETYEAAAQEWEEWESGTRIPIPVAPEKDSSVGAVVDQEIAWRRVHEHESKPGLIGRIVRRLGRS